MLFRSEAWFYDNGNYSDSEAGLYFSSYSAYANGTRAVGIINASDTTYMVSGKGTRLSQTGGNWNQGNKYGVRSDVVSANTDTGIARTTGWHQVTFVRKNTDASATVSDKGNSFPKSASYDIYLDGQKVYSETTDQAFVYMYGYAGFNSSNYAYIADPAIYQYIDTDVTITDVGGAYEANYSYYGTTGTQTASYKWQVSVNGETGWTDISGATSQTYTPTTDVKGKYVRAGVAVETAAASISYRYSDAYSVFDGVYTSISLGKSDCSFIKGSTSESQLVMTGYGRDGIERSITSFTNVDFFSSDTNVVTVNENGVLTVVDYGTATVTATSGSLEASILITVSPKNQTKDEFNSSSTAVSRRGSGAKVYNGATDTFIDYDNNRYEQPAYKLSTMIWNNPLSFANAALQAWFYDNGKTTDAEAGVCIYAYQSFANTGVLGIIDSGDQTYKLSDKNGRWSRIYYPDHTENATDTGIARTKGWHQVALVEGSDAGNSSEKTKSWDLYLDGKLVSSGANSDVMGIVSAYAGSEASTTAYFDDAYLDHYVAVKDVAIEKDGSALNVDYTYYGPSGTSAQAAVKWYCSDDPTSGSWTVISGENSASYTPGAAVYGKYVRAGVSITDTLESSGDIQTEEYFTNSYYVEAENFIEYRNGSVYINASEDIDDAVLIIAEYKTVGSFNKLVSTRIIENIDVTANTEKSVVTGTIAPASGNTVKVMLWENLNTQKALSDAINVN